MIIHEMMIDVMISVMMSPSTCMRCIADVWSQTGCTSGSLLYFIDFCHKARERKSWVRVPGFDSPGERDGRQGPSHANHPASSIFHLLCLIEVQNNFSIGDRLCPVMIIRGGSPQSPVMCGVWSSESPRSFLPLAIISHNQRILTGSQDPVTACT